MYTCRSKDNQAITVQRSRRCMTKTYFPDSTSAHVATQLRAAEPNHKPELDGIRGVALLAVMLSHAGPFIERTTIVSKLFAYAMFPGWSGVELFFVLSGFLITGILVKTKTAENYFSSFYIRRVLRIVPIYYLMLTLGVLAAGHDAWLSSVVPQPLKTRIAYYLYLQNWPTMWNHGLVQNPNLFGHFWSLAVEEQFYLVWPVIVWSLPENAILWICSAGLIAALPLRIVMVHRFAGDFTATILTTSRIDGLLVGAMLAIWLSRGTIRLRWIYLPGATGGAIIVCIALVRYREIITPAVYMPTFGITGFAFLSGGFVALSQHPIRWLRWILESKWLRTTGKYSYGMYIYHGLVYSFIGRVLTNHGGLRLPMPLALALLYIALLFAVTFLVAKISYDCFESRILALKIHFRPRFAAGQRQLAR